ncbi:MAG: NUDIX domain-containing protein, partial [Streptococcus thermophilus]|nr:NUDIX domain-containing protein [Streptococcus thermophilus]
LNGTYDKYPIKLPKKKPKPVQIQAFIIRNMKGEFLLEKNIDGRLLGGFWTFPIIETDFIGQQLSLFKKDNCALETVSQKAIFEENYALKPVWTDNNFTPVKHTFSHQKWTIEIVEGIVKDDKLPTHKELCWVTTEDFNQFPMATPQKKMIKTYEDSKKG